MTDLRLLVEFLNTLDVRMYGDAAGVMQRDQLVDPDALRRWLARREELPPDAVVHDEEWALAVRVRDGVRAALGGGGAAGGRASFQSPSISFCIRIDPAAGPVLQPDGTGADAVLGRILALAVAAASDGTWSRLKMCTADDCRRVFYDSSKNRSARWCSSRVCGNRMKTRSYRRRRVEEVEGSPTASAASPVRRVTSRTNVFRREGEYWRITYVARTFQLHDSKGLRYLARLLAEPAREWHVLDLVATDAGAEAGAPPQPPEGLATGTGDAGPMLDAAAKDAYRRRIEDLDDTIAEARSWGDEERAARAQEELEAIAVELSRAVGLGGRDRRAASDSERARVNVARVIKAAILRIDQHSPELKHHLASTVRTGTFCTYHPDSRLPVSWRF